jgi:hypothetical protein
LPHNYRTAAEKISFKVGAQQSQTQEHKHEDRTTIDVVRKADPVEPTRIVAPILKIKLAYTEVAYDLRSSGLIEQGGTAPNGIDWTQIFSHEHRHRQNVDQNPGQTKTLISCLGITRVALTYLRREQFHGA